MKKSIEVELFANRRLQTSSTDVELKSETVSLTKKDTTSVFEKNTKRNYSFVVNTDKLTKESELLSGSAKYIAGQEKGIASS